MTFLTDRSTINAESLLRSSLEINFSVIAEILEIGSKCLNNLILTKIKNISDFTEKISGMTYYNIVTMALAKNNEMKYIKLLFEKGLSGDNAMFMCDIDVLQSRELNFA